MFASFVASPSAAKRRPSEAAHEGEARAVGQGDRCELVTLATHVVGGCVLAGTAEQVEPRCRCPDERQLTEVRAGASQDRGRGDIASELTDVLPTGVAIERESVSEISDIFASPQPLAGLEGGDAVGKTPDLLVFLPAHVDRSHESIDFVDVAVR